MIYKVGKVQLVQGSNVVIGLSTLFLTNVSSGAFFKKQDEPEYYFIHQVIDNVTLQLDRPYVGETNNNAAYIINVDATPNLKLPLISKNDPDWYHTTNDALALIDRQAGAFLSYINLGDVDYVNTSNFSIRNDYHASGLEVGRAIKLVDDSEDLIAISCIKSNTLFKSSLVGAEVANTFTYSGETVSGEDIVFPYDVIHNETQNEKAFISSIGATNLLTLSGEVSFGWDAYDEINVYANTKSTGFIATVTATNISITETPVGATLSFAEFKAGDLLYNFTRNTTRSVLSASDPNITTVSSTDDWAIGDIVYTIQSNIETETPHLTSAIQSVLYGAQAQIGSIAIKAEHIDFGEGVGQVQGNKIPCTISGLSSTNVLDALAEIKALLDTHKGENTAAHNLGAQPFTDDGALGNPLTSTTTATAINELKARLNNGLHIEGVVDEGINESTLIDDSFAGYTASFFDDYSWYVRFDNGTNEGLLREINTFTTATGQFTVTTAFPYVPDEGDVFHLINMSSSIMGLLDSYIVEEMDEFFFNQTQLETSGQSTVHWNNITNKIGQCDPSDSTITTASTFTPSPLYSIHRIQANAVGSELKLATSTKARTITLLVFGSNAMLIQDTANQSLIASPYTANQGSIIQFQWNGTLWQEIFSYIQ